jgi:hypothetical protein
VRLTLGTQSVDLATRALVIGPPGPDAPDVVEITPAAAADSRRPMAAWVDPTRPALAAALDAGVELVGTSDPDVPLVELLPRCAATVTTVVVSAAGGSFDAVRARLVECAHQGEAAGFPPDRIVVEPILTTALLPHIRRFAELGYPLLLTVTASVAARLRGDQDALTALAVIEGARLIRTDAVKSAVRVCRVVSAILEAR